MEDYSRVIKKAIKNLDFSNITREMYKNNVPRAQGEEVSYNLNLLKQDFLAGINQYQQQFEKAFRKFQLDNNSMDLRSLNPAKTERSEKLILDFNTLNKSEHNQEMIKILEKGGELLLSFRHILTNQDINTYIYVQTKEGIRQYNKKDLIDNKVLQPIFSSYGAQTVSNPFSLAYEINLDALENIEALNKIDSKDNYYNAIIGTNGIKRDYLNKLSQKTNRTYEEVFFDSKDMEIFEYYKKQENMQTLELSIYENLRSMVGGQGGYRSRFYQAGDIGEEQVKLYNFIDGSKQVSAVFYRFSLLRDRLNQLKKILNMKNSATVIKHLTNFFTEKISDDDSMMLTINKEFSEKAKEELLKWN